MNSVLIRLLIDFLQIGFFSLGGGYAVIPLIKTYVVDQHHFLTLRQFTDIITISQMTPGPLAVNTSTFVGIQAGGILGATFATFGCIFSGFVISLLLNQIFQKYQNSQYAAEILKGLKASSLGLIVSAAATLLVMAFSAVSGGVNLWAVFLFLISLFTIRRLHFNPMAVMALTGIAGLLIYS